MRTNIWRAIAAAVLSLCANRAPAAPVDYHWQNVNAQSLIGVPDRCRTVVGMDGSLLLDRGRAVFSLTDDQGERPVAGSASSPQGLLRGYLPMVETHARSGDTRCELLAFAAADHASAGDLVRLTLTNLAASSRRIGAVARLDSFGEAPRADGAALYAGARLLAAVDHPRRGTAIVQVRRSDWGNESGWAPMPGWAAPAARADAGFRNATVGWAGAPITYAFRAAPGARLQLFAGFCEGYWEETRQRVLDVCLNGALVRTLDTVAELGRNVPGFVRGEAVADKDGWVRLTVQANPKARDKAAILNCVFVFPEDAHVDQTALIRGESTLKPLYAVACGSPSDQRLSAGSIAVSDVVGPGRSATFWLRFPAGGSAAPPAEPGERLLARTTALWDRLFRAGAQFHVPDRDLEDFYRASLAYCILLRERSGDYYVVKPGATVYNMFWMRDGAYIARAHGLAGYLDEEEKELRVFVNSPLPPAVNAMGTAPIEQSANGAWTAPAAEWDGQGQALWAVMSYFELTGDSRWLRAAYPAISKGARWTVEMRKKTKRPEDAGKAWYGLFPRGEGEAIVSNQFCLYHDFWGVLGIRKAAEAAEALGETADAEWMRAEELDFSACLDAAVRRCACTDSDGREYIPSSPGAAGARIWGDIAAVYPCDVMKPDDPLIASSLERMWARRLQDEYQFVDGRKIWTYITADWIQALWRQGRRDRALTLFWGYLNHAYPTKAWVEEMYPDTMIGTGDQPHGWAAANYLLLLRNMLVREEGGALQLLYGIPVEWLAAGRTVEVRAAPTTLGGPISFRAHVENDGLLTVTITQAPQRAASIRLNLPGAHVLDVEGEESDAASAGTDYVDLPTKAGVYEIRIERAAKPGSRPSASGSAEAR